MSDKIIHIIGGGLAGSEAAWQAAQAGCKVILHEMRPDTKTDAHQTDKLAELVCSNSFRSDDSENNAVGLLHHEMRLANSLIMACGDAHKLPAGGALAVDREGFSSEVSDRLSALENITVERGAVKELPNESWPHVIVATGPLTSSALATDIVTTSGEDGLAFFDAIAPIVYKESINFDVAWYQSRYDKQGPGGTGADYINCPLDEEQYNQLISDLTTGDTGEFKQWEKDTPYFDGCLPVEVMAERGPQTLRYGPLKPRGLTNSHQPDIKPYAVVQLRQDNALGTLYNIVGFQTKLKYAAQMDVLRKIPGLENAEFARLGGLHRNTFLNSPKLLDEQLRLKNRANIRFAGQITGVEGYVESAAVGLMAGRMAACEVKGLEFTAPDATTAHGALLNHITGGHLADTVGGVQSFQPMNVNFGLFPPVEIEKTPGVRLRGKDKKIARKHAYTARAKNDFEKWLAGFLS